MAEPDAGPRVRGEEGRQRRVAAALSQKTPGASQTASSSSGSPSAPASPASDIAVRTQGFTRARDDGGARPAYSGWRQPRRRLIKKLYG